MHNFDELLKDKGGKETLRLLIDTEGWGYKEALGYIGIKTSSRVTGKKLFDFCEVVMKYPKTSSSSRKWMLTWEQHGSCYWNNEFLVEETRKKLESPIINKTASGTKRGRITMWGHPSANSRSYQVSAHQIVWELANECFLPEGYEVTPVNSDFLDLSTENLVVRTTTSRKSLYASGERNYFYTGAPRYINYTRGWVRISTKKREESPVCEMCSIPSELSVNIHHIISYWLFGDNDTRVHSNSNLLSLCDSCHGKVHQNNVNITPLLSVTRCNELLELLENLKSQVSDTTMETYVAVEKQLGLTDNQQRSF